METDADEVFIKFKDLSIKEMKKALTQAIRESAMGLRKEVRANLRKSVKGANKKSEKYEDTLLQGVRMTKTKERNGEINAYVTITSNQKKKSQSYKLKFVEIGTKKRYTTYWKGNKLKKERYTGEITASHFYERAVENYQSKADKIMMDAIKKAVDKINNKKI